MPYVVTQSCCADASCILACPVNCIHPSPDEPGFAEAEMLYVDPQACVDCGACATACPVDAILPHTKLAPSQLPFVELNAKYYDTNPHSDRTPLALLPIRPKITRKNELRVAIVGAGPAALYAADALLKYPDVTVDVYDRLPTPYGLARAGVAPDHQHTKQVTKLFKAIENEPGFCYRLNVEVGKHITHEQLAAHYHGVLYAVGASSDRMLGIAGEDLPGSESATQVVGWYNGHPDHPDTYVDLTHERVVIVGNGNVALDVARILTIDPETLAETDIARSALGVLRSSSVQEVVVLGRRGPAEAAFTVPELVGLAGLEDVDVIVDNAGEPVEVTDEKTRLIAELANREPRGEGRRRIVLRFRTAPVSIVGTETVEGVEVRATRLMTGPDGTTRAELTGDTEVIPAGMVLRSVGYRGRPVAGLPFDEKTATVPNDDGRVEVGTYVAGWIKRGPTGFIGTNKSCAEQTVEQLIADFNAGLLAEPAGTAQQMLSLVRTVQPRVIDAAGWRAIDRAERRRGQEQGRPRDKFDNVEDMVRASRKSPKTSRRALTLTTAAAVAALSER